MNANTPLSPNLESHLRAVAGQQPDADRIDAAQQHLVDRIEKRRPRHRMTRSMAWVGTVGAAVLVLALTLGPVFTGHGDAEAFAAVQHRLRDFKTLHMTITQRANGIALPTIRSWITRAGDMRTDIGDGTSIIINVQQHAMITLLHAQHMAVRVPLDANAGKRGRKVLDWLDKIRRFKGEAQRLPGSRMIDGHLAHGWSLVTSGMHIQIWADADNVPRVISITGGVNLHQRLNMVLDQPIDPARFSTALPAGYHLAQRD